MITRNKRVAATLLKRESQGTANATAVAVSFSGTDVIDDPWGFFNPNISQSRLTIPPGLGGKYIVQAHATLSIINNGFLVQIRKGPTDEIRPTCGKLTPNNTIQGQLSVMSPVMPIWDGQYVELYVQQNDASLPDILGTDQCLTGLSLIRISD